MIKPFERQESTYHAFLRTEQWDEIRCYVIRRDGFQCRICGCKDHLQVHHIRYTDDDGNQDWTDTDWMVTLCAQCHSIITAAVEKARTTDITIDSFTVKNRSVQSVDWGYIIKRAAYGVNQGIVVETMVQLWERALRDDAMCVNFRNLDVLREKGQIVLDTLKYQANIIEPAFAAETIRVITERLAEGYNAYRSEGFTDQDIRHFFKLTDAQLYKVKENAQRLITTGTIRKNGVPADGAGGSG